MARTRRWFALGASLAVGTAEFVAAGCSKKTAPPPAAAASAPSTPAAPTPVGTDVSGRPILYWYDPMAPGSKFDKPGKSPFMDMELVPKYADEARAPGAAPGASAAAVTMSPRRFARPAWPWLPSSARPSRGRSEPSGRSRSTRRGRRGWPRASRAESKSSTPTSPGRRFGPGLRSTRSTARSSSRRSVSTCWRSRTGSGSRRRRPKRFDRPTSSSMRRVIGCASGESARARSRRSRRTAVRRRR